MKKRFKLLFCLVLAMMASTVTVSATTGQMYYRLRVKAILPDGSPASSFVACRGYYDQSAVTPTSNDYTMAVSSSSWGDYPDLNLYGIARNGEEFFGWYLDEACTQLLCPTLSKEIYNTSGAPGIAGITTYASAAEVQIQTIYAKFALPAVNWFTLGEAPTNGNYYLYGVGFNGLAGLYTYSDGKVVRGYKDPNQAVLFTLSFSSATDFTISCVDEGVTKYVNKDGNYIKPEIPVAKTLEAKSDGTYMVDLHRGNSYGYNWWEMSTDGSATSATKNESTTTQRWMFIPEATYNNLVSVESLKETGSITINSAPNASGTTNVKFNVSEIGPVASFDCSITAGDDGNFVLGTPTRSDNVITVPVTYTAQNVHSGTVTPIATATVTLTAKNEAASSAYGLVPVYVNFSPQFALNVNALDWSYDTDGETLLETYYAGMEVAASQRARLQNKLIYNPAQTTGVAANFATWTATIIGNDADQFKFANGTRTVSGLYTPELLDVIFAPTKTSEASTATLHIETSYTDANDVQLKYTQDIALSGRSLDVSYIQFAANGSETASDNESYSYGDIIGTNTQAVTAELGIHGVSNLTKVWNDPDGVFEFDVNSIDFSKDYQVLTFNAHRPTPVTTATNHTATLTISGMGSEGEVSAVLTLTYQALPLLTPTVTWKWSNIPEGTVATNPLTTTSDGAWTLTKTAGDKLSYNAETKTATAAYLHHEPGITATFAFSIEQTDTYAAMNETYTANISIYPEEIHLTTNAQFNDAAVIEHTSWEKFDESKHELYIDYSDNVFFHVGGHTMMSFSYHDKGTTTWTITEYYSDNSTKVIASGRSFSEGLNEFSFSPTTTKLLVRGSGSGAYFTDVRFSDNDTITADYERVVLINDNGTIYDLDVTATFSNTYSATVALNAIAAQYFELQTAGKDAGATIVFDNNDLGLGNVKEKVITITLKEGADAAAAKAATAGNACQVTFGDNYTYNHHEFSLPIVLVDAYDVTFKHHAHGSYTVTYEDDGVAHSVSSVDYVKHMTSIAPEHCTVTISAPTPATGYQFQGWKINDELVSFKASITKMFDEAAIIEPVFGEAEGAFKIDAAYFDDLTEALSVAGSIAEQNPVVTLMKDTILSIPATYTIPAGVTLLIPHKANFYEKQIIPEEVIVTAETLYAYRTLTLKDGVNFVVNGNICVAGKMMYAGGGNKSAYVTGGCAVINMVHGGHIEVNNGGNLYCWGFIKGQDMDQGNNTVGTGTVTANSGAVIWENFCLGDWRGGTASSNIYFEKDEKMLFPFQSYSIQNIEIPTTYKYGSKLMNTLSVHTGYGDFAFDVATIGSENTLFLLNDEASIVRKWYDPTTDLTCYELNGTALLGSLIINLPFVGEFDSGDCNLPISNSMHVIIANCNMTLAKPLTIQAGAVLEIKNTATVDLVAPIHMFDVDEWGLYIHNYYFRSFNNLTSHKNRGAENSKAGLDDAKVIIDGTLNIKTGANKGFIYATTGGANLMGNGGGVINFEGNLPTAGTLWQVNVLGSSPYITWVENPEAAANLRNEDGTYTRSISGAKFYNINGRWFHEEDKDADPETHTYSFTYMDNGNTGEDVLTDAVYSHDKTGLEARMKWYNVDADANCADWWIGQTDGNHYNYTYLNAWHQFMATETPSVYSGSNNKLYGKDECSWSEMGEVDENCLYTFIENEQEVKKALVDGHFIPLESNGYDPAYHATANASQYYICFTGCNWHPATPYTGESKAYTIHPEDEDLHYIWFNNDWLNVEREEPFFYTEDEQTNVRTNYEYVNGDWVVATPYVSVTDASETRTFYSLNEAFTVASLKKNATITILRDLPNITTSLVFSTQNTTCTLDLNGHIVTGSCANLLNINAPGSTFIVTDNSEYKNGELRALPSANSRQNGFIVNAGTLKLEAGKMYASNVMERESSSVNPNVRTTAIVIAAGATMNMTGGTVECVDEYNNYGISINASSATNKGVMNMSGGRVIVHATKLDSPYGILVNYGRLNLSGDAYIECVAEKTSTSYGVSVQATSYPGEFNMTGGTIYSHAYTSAARGVQVNGTATVTGDYNAATPDNTPKARYYATANISGGTIIAEVETSTDPYGVLSYGTTNISGGTITATVLKANQSKAWGVRTLGGTTTLSGSVNVTANAPTKAYALSCSAANGDSNRGWHHDGVLVVNGGTFTANTTNTTEAYGLYVSGTTYNINKTNGYSVFNGDYAAAGTATVNGGEFFANANTNTATGIVVDNTVTKNAASATPVCTVNGGKYKMTGASALNGSNAAASAENFHINGGYYSHDGNLATYTTAPKHVSELPNTDALYPDYKYEVANAYLIKFMNGETELQSSYQKENTTATYNGAEPTKASTELNSYIFDGWSATDGGDVVALASVTADATYYAHFNETTLKYTVKFDAKTNGGNEVDQLIYVDPNAAIGDLPTATKTGHTLSGWFTAASAGTQITASTEITANVTYYAQFTPNQHTLTWDANGGAIAGTYTKGTVNYGAAITAPTNANVTRAGYTFAGWDATPLTKMPDNDLTYTAQWTPKTNTAYTVQHKQQSLVDLSEYAVYETENLTGTTATYVTPKAKAYPGYITPAEQTVQIAADGSLVVEYLYDLIGYTITFDANGGTCGTASADVKHGATLTLPVATREGAGNLSYEFDGWFTKAVGGDQITASTIIQRNIGTLYAHWTEILATMDDILAENGEVIEINAAYIAAQPSNEVTNIIIENGGKVTVTENIMVTNLYLEGADATSGQLFAAPNKVNATNAYYDHIFNETVRHWRAFGVPWMVNLDATPIKEVKNQAGIPVNRTLVLGRDYDIVYYNGATRASQGVGSQCWEWVKDGSHILQPGKCYMIAFNSNVGTLRFAKSYGSPIVFNGTMNVAANTASDPANSGINAIANPMCYHTTMEAGPTTAQVHDGGLIGEDEYVLYNIEDKKFVVGKAVYVQVDAAQPVVINPAGSEGVITPAVAPKRQQAVTEKRYLSLNDYYAVAIQGVNETRAGRLYVLPEEDKADEYVIGHDLAKMGMSVSASQIWVKKYGVNLCTHTAAPVDGVTEIPVNIYAPVAGEYTITNEQSPISNENYTVYLTRDGVAVWNLSNGAYTLSLNKGTVSNYGLRLSTKSPQVVTGMDEAIIDAQGETRKVLINNQVFIIRGENVYTVDGQLVK